MQYSGGEKEAKDRILLDQDFCINVRNQKVFKLCETYEGLHWVQCETCSIGETVSDSMKDDLLQC